MANEFNAGRTTAEATIDFLIGGHTDANLATFISAQNQNLVVNNAQFLGSLIVQMLDRIESLEVP